MPHDLMPCPRATCSGGTLDLDGYCSVCSYVEPKTPTGDRTVGNPPLGPQAAPVCEGDVSASGRPSAQDRPFKAMG